MKRMIARRRALVMCIVLSFLPGLVALNCVLAKDKTDRNSSDPPASELSQPLKGSVVLDQAQEIKQLGDAQRKLSKAASDLYGEATTRQVVMEQAENLVGVTVIEVPVPVFTGNYLPPRKKWVDHYVDEMQELLPLIQEEYQDVTNTFPQNLVAEHQQTFDSLKALIADVQGQISTLNQLQAAGNYQNQPLAEPAHAIHKDMDEAIKASRKLFKALQKEEKKARSS